MNRARSIDPPEKSLKVSAATKQRLDLIAAARQMTLASLLEEMTELWWKRTRLQNLPLFLPEGSSINLPSESGLDRVLPFPLGEERELLNQLFAPLFAAVAIFDQQCRIVLASRSLSTLLGIPPDRLIGMSLTEAGIPADRAKRYEDEICQVFETGETYHSEVTAEWRGETHHFEYTYTPLRSKDGVIRAVEGVARDVTEQWLARRVIKEAVGTFKIEGVWVIDQTATTVHASQEMANMLGYTPEEMVGRSILDFVDPAHHEQFLHRLEERQQTGPGHALVEFRHKSGTPVKLSAFCAPLLHRNRGYAGAVALMASIS
jgi:PAS domain S-box-containing protein